MRNEKQDICSVLHQLEKGIDPEQKEKQVMIEKAINLKLMCDYVVSCSYGDIVLIIGMLHDYVTLLDESHADDVVYQAYYRQKFVDMADRLSEQIGYDYAYALAKCNEKRLKQNKDEGIGEDALILTVRTKENEKYGKINKKN